MGPRIGPSEDVFSGTEATGTGDGPGFADLVMMSMVEMILMMMGRLVMMERKRKRLME